MEEQRLLAILQSKLRDYRRRYRTLRKDGRFHGDNLVLWCRRLPIDFLLNLELFIPFTPFDFVRFLFQSFISAFLVPDAIRHERPISRVQFSNQLGDEMSMLSGALDRWQAWTERLSLSWIFDLSTLTFHAGWFLMVYYR